MTSLAIFTSAVEEGSVAAAARRHKITPAMAGRLIDSLEQALKARLLQRTTRRLHLTDVGRAYYQRSRRILEEFEEAQREAGELQTSPQGSLKIAVPESFAALQMGGPLARIARRRFFRCLALRGTRNNRSIVEALMAKIFCRIAARRCKWPLRSKAGNKIGNRARSRFPHTLSEASQSTISAAWTASS
jgi:DNA-binding transcriptional LysR family regulator